MPATVPDKDSDKNSDPCTERSQSTSTDAALLERLLRDVPLFPVVSKELIFRYNDCLERLGIPRTTLTSFHIDRMGWSPEIAQERADPYYLSAGIANPMAVLLSPDQQILPVLFPYNSYDAPMIEAYFDRFKYEIADITRTTCVGIDIDQELTRYESPKDLLLVEYIVIRSSSGPLGEQACEQKQLVQSILADGREWFDPRVRERLIDCSKGQGDLRFRLTEIPDFKFSNFRSFYTSAFGGVFVLKKPDKETLLVLEDKEVHHKFGGEVPGTLYLRDPQLLGTLRKAKLVEMDPEWYRKNPLALQQIREELIGDLICAEQPELQYAQLNATQKKQLLVNAEADLPEFFHEFERVAKQLAAGTFAANDHLSREVQFLLLRPSAKLSEADAAVVFQLLVRLKPWNIAGMYTHDKGYFAEQFMGWSSAKKCRAIAVVEKIRKQLTPQQTEKET